jgi:plasmid stabilization system protein ParE
VKVVWTDQALARLVAIGEFVAQDGPTAAQRLVASLVDRGDSLARLPRRGRPLPGHEQAGLRELIDGNFRIVYRTRGDTVEILTVFERHRLLPEEDLP